MGWRVRGVMGLAVLLGALGLDRAYAQAGSDFEPARDGKVIEIWKGQREMEFRDYTGVMRRFRVALGLEPTRSKRQLGDYRTPVGRYYVSEKRSQSRFRRFLGINYPNVDDAERGYADRLISADQWADIFLANVRGGVPPWFTRLGGRVGIHGHGGRPVMGVDWTEGCIAVSDEEIEYLYQRVPVGTPVIIHE